MIVAARWLAVAAVLGCCVFSTAASTETREEALPLNGHATQSELPPITTLRLHLRDGDYRIVSSDSDDITYGRTGRTAKGPRRLRSCSNGRAILWTSLLRMCPRMSVR